TGAPVNVSFHFQTPDVVSVTWAPPSRERRNGQLTKYTVLFHKKSDTASAVERNLTTTKAVFTDLEEHTEYVLQVRAHTAQGPGPYSERLTLRTERDIVRAPMSVRAVATSESSVEVWWEAVPSRGKVIGYQIFYTMTAVEDLDEWQQKSVGATESADLTSLEKYAQYALAVAARTKAQQNVPRRTILLEPASRSYTINELSPFTTYSVNVSAIPADHQYRPPAKISVTTQMAASRSYTINELSPFTTYSVNVSAIPADHQYRPPAKISVTTQMAAPQPMVKPDFYGVINGEEIQVILPQASEEYGPISHYFLVVVPEDKPVHKQTLNPDQFLTEELLASQRLKQEFESAPYIAARFPQRNIPYTFSLGNGQSYEEFINRKLQRGRKYRIFVRAIVDTPQKI
ncbi:hypothetical protein B566_EDAN008185, partial [Ephemera danica]